ncbi:ribosomal protein S18-alanine N-acetyltransferase [Loigolactobacillus backii]|uniref:Ribosomal-protein-alanine acetyltransferase n=1 Tax=Loigolactobacillus backii TaxID=375175 RepID=A0A192H3Q0_9LACO|nr:ribosomal protein S18-alanine N-acetyltransferase [Loigolactobacillus backii]ANK59174.1 ribosomal-protein-alanine acetyltransferase [Loigolactobacillus backii]ANK62586.1 ribosomal-protein-alanine acetyltransferase [Loigolactobacillus backii]ANK64164.1 ribosomal-protein-alanine acetyltransferase [Loigolactobacillus backii]ANK67441.1 ribosomal-protein-alanine acetyltransferase [Loigolactobacillus backii]ANK70403.1 ribosomal-protein-alanine acetyltransferase [Loigolactobacillus backii]
MWKRFKDWYQHSNTKPTLNFLDQAVNLGGQNFSMRRAQQDDVDDLLEVERQCYAGTTPWDRAAFLSELKKTTQSLYVVLIFEGEIVAFIGCWFTKTESHVTNIAVVPKFQNFGIGRFLMLSMIQRAADLPSARLTLEVRVSNEPAKHLYHQLGFLDQNIKRSYYVVNHEDALNMMLPLGEEN